MGTELTPRLNLIMPDENELMRDFVAQQGSNLDTMDRFREEAFNSYTVELRDQNGTLVPLGTDPNIEGFWKRVWGDWIWFKGRILFGVGGGGGTGAWRINLPVAAETGVLMNANMGRTSIWGSAVSRDNDSGSGQLIHAHNVIMGDSMARDFVIFSNMRVSGSRFVAGSFPFTFTASDRLSWYGIYRGVPV